MSLSCDTQADGIEFFNLTSRYLDDFLNIDNPHFEGMVNQIDPAELQLNKANTSDTEAPFLDLQLFTWLSLVVSLMASFVLSFFPLDVLDEILDLIVSVSEGFLTYSYI